MLSLALGLVCLAGTSRLAAVETCVCGFPCDQVLSGLEVTGSLEEGACNTLAATDVTVQNGGILILRAGLKIALENDFQVATGGELTLRLESELGCSEIIDSDGDTFAQCHDCDDQASSCTTDCNDSDLDLRADCRDLCLDLDTDGYGFANANQTIGAGADPVGQCTTDGSTTCALGPACQGTDCDEGSTAIHQGAQEICNNLDDDCDGLTDAADGSLEVGPLNSNQQGECAGTRQSCSAGSWTEDYSSVPGYSLPEIPDGQFADENCDGIDGTVSDAVFVSTADGTNGPTCGTLASPCQTIDYGASRATTLARPHLYLRAGTYAGGVTLVDGLSLYGGFDSSWSRAAVTTAGHETVLTGSGSPPRVVTALGVTSGLADLILRAPDALSRTDGRGDSSYGVHATSSTLTLRRLRIEQGDGASGASGSPGTWASQSRAPGGGSGGQANDVVSACAITGRGAGGAAGNHSCSGTNTRGGGGGSGGTADTCCTVGLCTLCDCSATNGSNGFSAALWTTNGYGYRGTGGLASICQKGGSGNDGYERHAAGGSGGGSGGRLIGGYWYAHDGAVGGLGQHGGGGGGGGGSGGCDTGTDSYGAGGGGGGAGGCRAPTAGSGGKGAGGSFGVFAISSTLTIESCSILRGAGGAGGRGGNGGRGQPGGLGGSGGSSNMTDSGPGGAGGAGGDGGNSGGGGGGGGGSSFCIYTYSSTVNLSGNAYSGGSTGAGGAGGHSQGGPPGGPGAVGELGTIDTCASPAQC